MRCAIVHYWLLGTRGGERVLEAICELFPDADIFTLFYEPERVSETIRKHHVEASFLNPLARFHRHTLPLMPFALESFDLRSYDLVITSESGPAKGVIAPSNARHVCYCHSPMRYLWDLYPAYLHEWTPNPIRRIFFAAMANYLRIWDASTALRVDEFVANSKNVQRRIWRAYHRDSEVIYPPVDTTRFFERPSKDYFLIVSALVEYKRVQDAVKCFSRSGQHLKIVGEGPQYRDLRSMAASNVEFCGRVTDDELADLYAHCRAVIMPGEEDFGIVPVEALASGKAVIALGEGGVLETVPTSNPCAGVLYDHSSPEELASALRRFEVLERQILPKALQRSAARFSKANFLSEMARLLGRSSPAKLASSVSA